MHQYKFNKDDLITYWTLNQDEAHESDQIRGPANRILFSAQLLHVKAFGRFLPDLSALPIDIINHIAVQLNTNIDINKLDLSYTRKATETAHTKRILQHLSYKKIDQNAIPLTLDKVKNKFDKIIPDNSQLLAYIENTLIEHGYCLPPKESVDKICSSFRKKLFAEIYSNIANRLTVSQKTLIDELLSKEDESEQLFTMGILKRSPPEPTPKVINNFIDKHKYLSRFQIKRRTFMPYAEDVLLKLFRTASCYSSRDLRRLREHDKKYALTAIFLYFNVKAVADHIIELNDNMLTVSERRARNLYKKELIDVKNSSQDGIFVAMEILMSVLNSNEGETIEQFIDNIGADRITYAISSCQSFNDLKASGPTRKMQDKYNLLRRYMPQFFEMQFYCSSKDDPLMKAVWLVRNLNSGKIKKLPTDAPISFISKAWKNKLYVDGDLCRKTWEMGVYFALKKAIRAGQIYLPESNKYQGFIEVLQHSKKSCGSDSQAKPVQTFENFHKEIQFEFGSELHKLQNNITNNSLVKLLPDGKFSFKKDDPMEIPSSTINLKRLIGTKISTIRIEKLLSEVDSIVNFSSCFTPHETIDGTYETNPIALYASLIAHGTNIGLFNMGQSSEGVTIDMLRHASKWLIREETLAQANKLLINKHFEMDITKYWGKGNFSSSDGQRFGIQKSSNLAAFYPRYFGYYDKAINIYTHVSDKHSVFGTKVISCNSREALYVLDAILQNNTLLSPTIHSTDTHGYTEHVFGLCYLLGVSFMPRIKDLSSQRIYWLDSNPPNEVTKGFFHDVIDLSVVEDQWDNLAHIIDSLKTKKYSASWFLEKLSNRPSSDKISKALGVVGKVAKSIYIMHYIWDNNLRRNIHAQLNRGESRHQLAKHLFFANQGYFRTNDYEEIMNKASCLSFLSNAVLFWNTKNIQSIIANMKEEGAIIDPMDLTRISPLWFKDILVHGSYDFTEINVKP